MNVTLTLFVEVLEIASGSSMLGGDGSPDTTEIVACPPIWDERMFP